MISIISATILTSQPLDFDEYLGTFDPCQLRENQVKIIKKGQNFEIFNGQNWSHFEILSNIKSALSPSIFEYLSLY